MEPEFEARAGDEVSVESHRLRGSRRTGTIVEVMGSPGHEYYRVRWEDGRETVLHPGSDVAVVPKTRRRPRRRTPAAPPKAAEPARPAGQAAPPARPGFVLRAVPGDRLVIRGHHLGEPDRDAEIIEALGEGGTAPFRVRWSDSGRESLLFPGGDAVVDHIAKETRRRASREA
jgi:hypothetical protein